MIYKDPFMNATVKEGKWFAWFPVQLEGENRTAWLCYVERVWTQQLYVYRRLSK